LASLHDLVDHPPLLAPSERRREAVPLGVPVLEW